MNAHAAFRPFLFKATIVINQHNYKSTQNEKDRNSSYSIDGSQDDSYWPYLAPGSLTMDAGVLDFKSVGIHLCSNSFTETITGGLIRTVGNFLTTAGVTFFTPEGGAVEMYGDAAGQAILTTGCYFHDFYAAKYSPAVVNTGSNLVIKGELKVKSSEFKTNGYLISVGN